MKKLILLLLVLFQLNVVMADVSCDVSKNESFDDLDQLDYFMLNGTDTSLPAHKQAFCAGYPRNVSGRLNKPNVIFNNDDTLYFQNPPGPINAGMCWLHTRLQRQFTYLANYRSDKPKPSKAEAMKLINRIVNREGITEIPGYKNLSEFSKEYEKELTEAIDTMGWKCTFNPTDCPARITDSYSPSPKDVQGTMEKLYTRHLAMPRDILMIRTRMSKSSGVTKPFEAHSMLILDMEPIREPKKPDQIMPTISGYRMKVIDPNYQTRIETVDYKFGDTKLNAGLIDVIPYTHYEYDGDIPEMNKFIDGYCKK